MNTAAAMPDDDPEKMREIEIVDKASLEAIAKAMKAKERFIIVTDDPNFKPLGYDRHSAEVWIGAAGGGLLMTIGAGVLVLAFMDPEPTTKLGLMVGGGIAVVLAGGTVVLAILITRSRYTSVMRRNPESGQYEWILEPGR
jgi:hypothetical protein